MTICYNSVIEGGKYLTAVGIFLKRQHIVWSANDASWMKFESNLQGPVANKITEQKMFEIFQHYSNNNHVPKWLFTWAIFVMREIQQ